jgi:hypothetical protein
VSDQSFSLEQPLEKISQALPAQSDLSRLDNPVVLQTLSMVLAPSSFNMLHPNRNVAKCGILPSAQFFVR